MKKIILILLFFLPFLLKATNYVPNASGNWSIATNWFPTGVPGAGDNVTITTGFTMTLNATESVYGLTINSGGTLTVAGTKTLNIYGDLTINGTFTYSTGIVNFSGTINQNIYGSAVSFYDLNIKNTGSVFNNNVSLGTNIVVTDKLTLTSGIFNMSSSSYSLEVDDNFINNANTTAFSAHNGTVTLGNGTGSLGSLTLGGSSSTVFYNLIINPGATYAVVATTIPETINNDLTVNSGNGLTANANTITVVGNVTNNGSSTITFTTGTFAVTGNVTNSGTIQHGGTFTVGGTFINNGGGTISFTTGTFTVTGNVQNNLSGIISFSTGTFNAPGGILNFGTITYTSHGIMNTTGFSNSGTSSLFTAGTATVSVAGPVTNFKGGISFTSGSLTLTGASGNYSNVFSGGIAFTTGTFTVSGNVGNSGGITFTTGTMTVAGTLTNNTFSNISFTTGTLTVNGSVSNEGSITHSGTFTVGGNVANTNTGISTALISFTTGTFAVTGSVTNTGTILYTGKGLLTADSLINITTGVVTGGIATVSIAGPVINSGSITFSTGELALTGSNGTVSSSGTIVFTGAGFLNLTGNFINTGTFTPATSTVTFDGSIGSTYSGISSFYNLTVLKLGASLFLSSNLLVTGDLLLSMGTLDVTPSNYTLTVDGTFTNNASTTAFNGRTGTETLVGAILNGTSGTTFYNLTITPTGTTVTANTAPVIVTNNLLVTASKTFACGTNTVTVDSSVVIFGKISFTSGAFNIGKNFTNNGTYTPGTGTVTFNGNINQAIGGSTNPTTFYSLTTAPVSSVDTTFLNIAVKATHSFNITNQGVFDCQTNQVTGTATSLMNMTPFTTLVLGLTSSPTAVSFPATFINTNISLDPTSYVVYQANTASQTISPVPEYGNLVISSGSSSVTKTHSTTATLTMTGSFLILSNATYNQSTQAIILSGSLTISASAALSTTTGPLNIFGNFTNNGTYTAGNGTVTMQGGGFLQTIGGAVTPTFYNLTIQRGFFGAASILPTSISITNNLSIISGKLQANTSLSSNINIGGNFTNSGGIFNPANSIVTMDGSNPTLGGSTPLTLYKLVIGTTGTTTLAGNISTASDITINSGATFNAASYQISIAGNFIDDGTFTAGTGLVYFDNNGNQCVSGTSSSTTVVFQNMTVSGLSKLGTSCIINIDGTITIIPGGQLACACP